MVEAPLRQEDCMAKKMTLCGKCANTKFDSSRLTAVAMKATKMECESCHKMRYCVEYEVKEGGDHAEVH